MFLCGIDVGTTGSKALLYDEQGRSVAEAYEEYPIHLPRGGWAEQDSEHWWRAVCASVTAMLANAPAPARRPGGIAAVAVSAQAPTLLPLDASLKPLRPALIWMDRRAEPETAELRERFGEEWVLAETGNRPDPFYVAAKILWFRRHEPETFASTRWFLQITGYINYRLTGVLSMDPVHAALLGLRKWNADGWSEELCEYCGVEPGQFPPVRSGEQVIGTVTSEAAEVCGLAVGTPVVAGTVDGSAAALEAGALEPGIVAEMTGTSTVLLMPNRDFLTAAPFIAMPHAIAGTSLLLGAMSATGASLRWFRDELGEIEREQAAQLGIDPYELLEREAEQAAAGSGGLVFLPYMMGERAPIWDSNARGVFFGLTLATRRSEMIRSIMEGAAFALRHNVEVAVASGLSIEELRSVGGGSRSGVWNQIKADVLDLPVAVPERSGGAPFGDAVLAGMGAGLISDPRDFVSRAVQIRRRFVPRAERRALYDRRYTTFRELYESLRPVFDHAGEERDDEE